jgi:hypothetical protein
MLLSAAGMATCALAMYGVIKLNIFGLPEKTEPGGKNRNIKMDGPSQFPSTPSVIRIQGQDGVEQVVTGNSAVPHFPSTITLPRSFDVASLQPGQDISVVPEAEEEYQLLGLGIRTVSFLSIQVYIVGLYVAKSDISALQQQLVRTAVQPLSDDATKIGTMAATSLVSTERDALKHLLLDPEKGEDAWDAILKEGGVRMALRIVPTRNTDFLHLRDGWIRGIVARTQRADAKAKALSAATSQSTEPRSEFQDESFGKAVTEFKSLFGRGNRKSVPKGQVVLLLRDAQGVLDALLHAGPAESMRWLGRVADGRISRLIWLNYLAGKTVASEAARQSIVDGVMGIVERPVGTVIQKVV